MFKFGRTMNIKEQCYFNRGPVRSPGKFLKSMHVQTFWTPPPLFGSLKLFWPPFGGFETFLTPPPFLELQNFFDPLLIFQPPPHQGIYERSLSISYPQPYYYCYYYHYYYLFLYESRQIRLHVFGLQLYTPVYNHDDSWVQLLPIMQR